DAAVAVAALFLAQVVSRTAPLPLIYCLVHVGDAAGSKSKPLADGLSVAALLAGLLWMALALWLVIWWSPGMAWWGGVLGSALGSLYMARLLQRRLQGFTGDGLGATQQVAEVLFYLGVVLTL